MSLEDLEIGDPVDGVASMATLVTPQAVSQSASRRRSRVNVVKLSHRAGIPIGWHGDVVLRGATVHPGGLGLRRSSTSVTCEALPLDRRRLCSSDARLHTPRRSGRRRSEHSPKRDHVRATVRVTGALQPQLPGPRNRWARPAPVVGRPRFPHARAIVCGSQLSGTAAHQFLS